MAEEVDVIYIDIQFGVLLAGIVNEEHHDEEEMDKYEEGVDIFVIVGNPHEQDGQIANAKVYQPSQTAGQGAQVQRIFEFQVLIAELDLLEEEEDHTVDQYSHLIVGSRADNGSEQVQVVAHHQPLEDQHVVDMLRTQGGLIYCYRNAVVLGVHASSVG